MIENLAAEFEKNQNEYMAQDDRIKGRADLHAFNLLDRLAPSEGGGDLISASEHDEFFLDVDLEALAKAATPEDITMLVRCGVRYSKDFECLCMFA